VQIRVYAEAIEQGEVLFLPFFESAFPDDEVKLVRSPKVHQVKGNRGLKGVFDLANPDGLATIVEDGQEFPFATFEISDAVKTEDHELQRFPQICSSMAYDLIHIKISPHHKQTKVAFGGNVNFDPLTIPRILRDEYQFRGAFMLNWPNGDSEYVCNRNPDYPSCPAEGCIELLQAVIVAISKTLQGGERPCEGTYEFSNQVWTNLSEDAKRIYESELDSAPSRLELFEEWASMTIPSGKGYLRKRMISAGEVLVTIPRFDRDSPGPGEVMSYAMMSDATTVGIAYCGRDRSMRIDSEYDSRKWNLPCNSIQDVTNRFFDIFSKKKDKMPIELLQLLKRSWNENETSKIDITAELIKLTQRGKMKKWVMTMVFFADYLMIHDRPHKKHPITFHWNRSEIIGYKFGSAENPMGHLQTFNEITQYPPLVLIDPTHMPVLLGGEDYVTWAAAMILKQMGWKFVALSYPGSQGDGAILPTGESGLSRQRTYCDGLGVKESCGLLLEAKHMEHQIAPDVIKLIQLTDKEGEALSTVYSRLGEDVDKWQTCVAFGVEGGGIGKRSAGTGMRAMQRRMKLRGVDFAFTVWDKFRQCQLVRILDGEILHSGDLPIHRMHSVATKGKIPPSTFSRDLGNWLKERVTEREDAILDPSTGTGAFHMVSSNPPYTGKMQ
jgi:hypothetical protein